MLKTRIIPCLLFKDRSIVKSVGFTDLRMIGDPTTVARVFNQREADELIFLDIMATRENRGINFKVIEDIAKECFMPLTIGGGIRTMEDADRLFHIGADKISLNTAAVKNPELIKKISEKYGAQAVVVSIDAKKVGNNYRAFISSGTEDTGLSPSELAKRAEQLGAGEILINSIDHDGKMDGYDTELIEEITRAVSIPVIAAGGCGKLDDFENALKAGDDAVCAASIFYFVGESIITAKKHLMARGVNVRNRDD